MGTLAESKMVEVLTNIEVNIDEKEVLRLQGYRHHISPRPAVRKLVVEEIAEGCRLIRPQAIWGEVRVREMRAGAIVLDSGVVLGTEREVGAWQGAGYLVVALCTIGPVLERRVAELFSEQNFAAAVMLDSVGSVAAEGVADHVNWLLCHRAMASGLKTGPRLSPGYGKWQLSAQRALFSILDGGEIGLRLNEQCMMIPRKSVSFCVGVGAEVVEERAAERCRYCGMKGCHYRRDSSVPGSPQ